MALTSDSKLRNWHGGSWGFGTRGDLARRRQLWEGLVAELIRPAGLTTLADVRASFDQTCEKDAGRTRHVLHGISMARPDVHWAPGNFHVSHPEKHVVDNVCR